MGNNPVKYVDPDGRKLYINGSKKYMAEVQNELKKICDNAIINFDTGEVTLTAFSKNTKAKGYALLLSLINSNKTNIIWIGNSRSLDEDGNLNGNSCNGYSTEVYSVNGRILGNECNGAQNSVINFDPNNWEGGIDDKGSTNRPPYIGLSHEMGHSQAINNGTQVHKKSEPKFGETPVEEMNSMKWENYIRLENDLTPRSYHTPSLEIVLKMIGEL